MRTRQGLPETFWASLVVFLVPAMFKALKKNHGQATMSQYVVLFFLAIGSLIAMTTFVQRALQARIRDTKIYMVDNVQTLTGINVSYEYEPYYANVSTVVDRNRNEQIQLLQGGATGIFRKTVNGQVIATTTSEQAPPKDVSKAP